LGLYRVTVQPTEPPRTNPDETVFVLTTRRGAQVLWGVAPQVDNVTDVKKALSKVERLVAYVEQHGPLDGLNAGAQIDLTHVAIPGQRNASVPNRDGD
jgi:hypothetical protein